MAADNNFCEKREFQNNCDKEEDQENDFGHLRRFGSTRAAKKRKTDRNSGLKRKSLDELSIASTLSRWRRGFAHKRLSLRRPSFGNASATMRRLSSSQAGPRRTLSNLHGSWKLKLKKSLRMSSRTGTLDYSATLRSTPRRMQYLQLLSALRQTSGQEGNGRQDDPLWQKIEHELRMKEGAAKLLAANRNPGIALEAGKSLLTSTARLNAYMNELQAHKALCATEGTSHSDEELKPCRATVTISDLRIPLVWKDADHFLNKSDRHYAAFCLLHLGSTVCDTSLLFDIDRKTTELSFDDVITFEATDNKFEVQLEIYLHRICQDLRLAFTPLKNRKRLSDISISVGKRLSGIAEESADQKEMLIGPRFDCIARATLSMKDAEGSIDCYDLLLNPLVHEGSSAAFGLMLFGNFCCRLTVQPSSLTDKLKSGWLSVRSQSESEWKEFWCRLECSELLGWLEMSAVNTSVPTFRVSLDQETEIQRISLPDDSKNSNQFMITTKLAADKTLQYEITSDDMVEDLNGWNKALLQHICDLREWKDACKSVTEVPATPFKFKTLGRSFSVKKNESLASAGADSPMTRILTRLNINNILPSDTSDRLQMASAPSSLATESSIFV